MGLGFVWTNIADNSHRILYCPHWVQFLYHRRYKYSCLSFCIELLCISLKGQIVVIIRYQFIARKLSGKYGFRDKIYRFEITQSLHIVLDVENVDFQSYNMVNLFSILICSHQPYDCSIFFVVSRRFRIHGHLVLTTLRPILIRHSSSCTSSARRSSSCTDSVILALSTGSLAWVSVCSRRAFIWGHHIVMVWCGLNMSNRVSYCMDGDG